MMRVRSMLLVVSVLFACGRSPYAGFDEAEDDVHVKLHSLGDGDVLAQDSDHVVLHLRIARIKEDAGSLFSTERTYRVTDLRQGALAVVLDRMHAGDSMSVFTPASLIPWSVLGLVQEAPPSDTTTVRMEIRMVDLLSPAMLRAEEERQRALDPTGYATRLLKAWLDRDTTEWTRWGTSGLYYQLTGEPRDTNAVRKGDLVIIEHRGARLEDGKVVDDPARSGGAFSWVYGDPDQVINGLEVAVSLLREGRSGRFIFPPEYAFGSAGVPGLVDPFTPMIYEVRSVRFERRSSL